MVHTLDHGSTMYIDNLPLMILWAHSSSWQSSESLRFLKPSFIYTMYMYVWFAVDTIRTNLIVSYKCPSVVCKLLSVVAQWWEHWWLNSVALGLIPSDYQHFSLSTTLTAKRREKAICVSAVCSQISGKITSKNIARTKVTRGFH